MRKTMEGFKVKGHNLNYGVINRNLNLEVQKETKLEKSGILSCLPEVEYGRGLDL